MMRTMGLAGCCVVCIVPTILQPHRYLLAGSGAAALLCVGGVLMTSVSLALFGSVTAVFVFCIALLTSLAENGWLHAVLVGLGLLAILAGAHQGRFRGGAVVADVARAQMTDLAVTVFLSFIAAAAIALVANGLPTMLTGSVRAVVSATGCIITMAALVHAASGEPKGSSA